MRIAIPQSFIDFRKWAEDKVPARKENPPDSFPTIRRNFFYLTRKEVRQIEAAHSFAREAHKPQKRKDGSPYILHPMAVAVILANMQMDATTIVAALLHDVVEDCNIDNSEIKAKFGERVGIIVDGLTKLEKLEGQSVNEQQAENFQKMILAMASDIRIILVKLADRLHNMRTLGSMKSSSQKRIARETIDIYAPISNRIGLDEVYRELQDLAFLYLYPMRSRIISNCLAVEFQKREASINRVQNELVTQLKKVGIKAEVSARQKTPFSVYCKMRSKKFAEITDIIGMRIIVEKKEQCYQTLGIVHTLYKPNMTRLKDFIALPKTNGYQSLHTTVRGPSYGVIEIQIRSRAMEWVATSGLAAHWLYKNKSEEVKKIEDNTNQWISSIIDLKQKSANAGELLENVKIDLFNQSVYIFTPKGKIVSLPRGATALDFAYIIHSEIGHYSKFAIINGEKLPLQTELHNGDMVEIKVSENSNVSVASISYAKTARARSVIRNYLRTVSQQSLRDLGEHWFRQILMDISFAHVDTDNNKNLSQLNLSEIEKLLVQEKICASGQLDKIFTDIALGNISPLALAKKIIKKDINVAEDERETLIITSNKMPQIQMNSCCFPIPGDDIIGVLRKGEGVVIHRKECRKNLNSPKKNPNALKDDINRQINVEWDSKINDKFTSRIIVTVDNSQGVLADVSRIMAEQNCNIVGLKMHTSFDSLTPIGFDVLVSSRFMLSRVIRKLKHLQSVKSINRFRE